MPGRDSRRRTLRLRTPWLAGAAPAHRRSVLISYTDFRPDRLRDVPAIFWAGQRLRRICANSKGSVGLVLWWQPLRRRSGSVSVWTDRAALEGFLADPYHVEIMRRYRDRGTMTATAWIGDYSSPKAAIREAMSTSSGGLGRRSAS